jgi:hypothetical protein
MEQGYTVAAMMNRFRNEKPTSREERERKAQQEGNRKMVWETDNRNINESPGGNADPAPRSLSVNPTSQSTFPNSALRSVRQPNDYLSNIDSSLYLDRKLGDTYGLDDHIATEIRLLQQEAENQDRATSARLNLGSYEPTRSLDVGRSASPVFRFTGRDSNDLGLGNRSARSSRNDTVRDSQPNVGLSDSTGDFLRKYNIGSPYTDGERGGMVGASIGDGTLGGTLGMGAGTNTGRRGGGGGGGGGSLRTSGAGGYGTGIGRTLGAAGDISPLRLSRTSLPADSGDNYLRSSVETLGSTGFRGLLVPRLKLDGQKEKEETAPDDDKEDLEKATAKIAELLRSLGESHPPKNSYFPEGVDETIPQITNKVQSQITEFAMLFGDKHLQEDEAEKARKERDELMREEGRKAERERRLMDLDLPETHPLEYLGVWDGAYQQQQQQQRLSGPHTAPYFANAAAKDEKDLLAAKEEERGAAALRLSDDSVGGESIGSPFPHFANKIGDGKEPKNEIGKEGFSVEASDFKASAGWRGGSGSAHDPAHRTARHALGIVIIFSKISFYCYIP